MNVVHELYRSTFSEYQADEERSKREQIEEERNIEKEKRSRGVKYIPHTEASIPISNRDMEQLSEELEDYL